MNAADRQVIKALGSKIDQFRALARGVVEHPETRPQAEAEMATLLGKMTIREREELRNALLAAGAYKHQRVTK